MHYQSPSQPEARPERLNQAFDPRRNSLGFLRFVFAVLVLIDHSFDLGGFDRHLDPMWQATLGQESLAGFAVGGFFVISGFLITRSYMTSRSAGTFMWRRFLRIFPGFWACLLVTAFAFAPLAWWHQHGSLSGFAHAPSSAAGYVSHNFWLVMHQYAIAGLLANTPYYAYGHSLAFNGSLWTLVYEFKCYLGVAVLGLLGILRRARMIVLGLAVFFWAVQFANTIDPGSARRAVWLLGNVQLVRLSLFFAMGAVMWLYAEKIPMTKALAGVAGIVLVVSLRNHLYYAVGEVAFAYLVMWLATVLPLTRFDAPGDFSYGIYIYAFPVEQMLSAWKFNRFGFLGYISASLALTMVLAVASWFVIERPFLSLKRLSLKRLSLKRLSLERLGLHRSPRSQRWKRLKRLERRQALPNPPISERGLREVPPGRVQPRREVVGTGRAGGPRP